MVKRIELRLEDDLYNRIKESADNHGLTVSSEIRVSLSSAYPPKNDPKNQPQQDK